MSGLTVEDLYTPGTLFAGGTGVAGSLLHPIVRKNKQIKTDPQYVQAGFIHATY